MPGAPATSSKTQFFIHFRKPNQPENPNSETQKSCAVANVNEILFFPTTTLSSSFDAAISAFILSRRIKNLSPSTLDWYQRRLFAFAKFCQQRNETPKTLSRQTVVDYLQLRCQHFTPQTANGDLRAIRAFLRWLIQEGILENDPTKGIERLKEPAHLPRTLSDDQITALINTIAKHSRSFAGLRDLTLVCLLLDTGLRISEACNLKLPDIDLSQGFVRVFGKGNRERMVPIGESLKLLLLRYLVWRSSIPVAGNWLFVTTLRTKLNKDRARERLQMWAKKAGIEGVRVSPHSLRFTFVRKWLQSGGDSLVLQRILGHSSPAMTSYYARLFASDLKDAHKRHSPIDTLAPTLKLPRKRIQ